MRPQRKSRSRAFAAWSIVGASAIVPMSPSHGQTSGWPAQSSRVLAIYNGCELRDVDPAQYLRAVQDAELPTEYMLRLLCSPYGAARGVVDRERFIWVGKPATVDDAVWSAVFVPIVEGDEDDRRSIRRALEFRPSELDTLIEYATDAVVAERGNLLRGAEQAICDTERLFETAAAIRRTFAEVKELAKADRSRVVGKLAGAFGAEAAERVQRFALSTVIGETLPTIDTEATYSRLSLAEMSREAKSLCTAMRSKTTREGLRTLYSPRAH